MTRVAGIDIARGAWLIVYLEDGAFAGSETVTQLAGHEIEAEIVAIDVPLSLPDTAIGRPAEAAARAKLGARRSSVFSSLPIELYTGAWSDEARTDARRRYGKAFSKQSWNLGRAVIDASLSRTDRWYETHPELAFTTVAGLPLESKKSWAGVRQRLDCLEAVGIEIPVIGGALHPDDALDAAMCAHVADRIRQGVADSVPDTKLGPHIWF